MQIRHWCFSRLKVILSLLESSVASAVDVFSLRLVVAEVLHTFLTLCNRRYMKIFFLRTSIVVICKTIYGSIVSAFWHVVNLGASHVSLVLTRTGMYPRKKIITLKMALNLNLRVSARAHAQLSYIHTCASHMEEITDKFLHIYGSCFM